MLAPIRYNESVTLAQTLIDTPGYGTINQELVNGGFWDESQDPDNSKFVVWGSASVTIYETGWAEIYAKDMDEAKEKANALNEADFEWDRSSGERGELIDFEISEICPGED